MIDIEKELDEDFKRLLKHTRHKNLNRAKAIFFISGVIVGATITEIVCLFFK